MDTHIFFVLQAMSAQKLVEKHDKASNIPSKSPSRGFLVFFIFGKGTIKLQIIHHYVVVVASSF